MISFIGMSTRSSGIIRGKQISSYTSGNFFDYSAVNILDLKKIVIFIRKKPPADFVKFLKSRGHVVGYDILDLPAADFTFRGSQYVDMSPYLDDDNLDFYIVNNDFMKNQARNISSKLVYVIPHHTVNFARERFSNGDSFSRVGYVGLPEQSGPFDRIDKFCHSAGCTFSVYDPKTREECIEAFKNIDIGIVYIDPADPRKEYIFNFKPNTKLNNFQSFGIPTICSSYISFKQFGNNACLFSDSDKSLESSFVSLVSDTSLRNKISNDSYDNSQEFFVEKIAKEKYGEIVRDFTKKVKK